MAVENVEIARLLDRVADLLEIEAANPFRVRAYRNAARIVRGLPRPISERIAAGEGVPRLPGIGKDLAGKIEEIVASGRLGLLDEIERRTSPELAELLAIPGLGPKRVRLIRDRLGVSTLAELGRAARRGAVRELPGLGVKTEQSILAALARRPAPAGRVRWSDAEPVARSLVEHLRATPGVDRVEVAGSFRRRSPTLGDLDLLVACAEGSPVIERFAAHPEVAEVLARGTTRSTVRLRSGLQVDVRVVAPESYGAALHYFTGSKAHNIAVRRLGVRRGLKINEYGVFRGARRIAGATEEEVFRCVGLPYIEPELREERGEIEAARAGRLPRLVASEDLRGDLHARSPAGGGRSTLDDWAEGARRLGWSYLAVADPVERAGAGGQGPRELARQLRRIERWNAKRTGFVLLKSADVEILEDGSLDLPDEILAELDVAIGSLRADFGLSGRQQTARLLRALEHPRLHVLADPTGRLLATRGGWALDLERVLDAAAESGCGLELGAGPDRADVPEVWCRLAKERGVRVAISSEARAAGELERMRLGVAQARRGWLEAGDVINARSWAGARKLLRSR